MITSICAGHMVCVWLKRIARGPLLALLAAAMLFAAGAAPAQTTRGAIDDDDEIEVIVSARTPKLIVATPAAGAVVQGPISGGNPVSLTATATSRRSTITGVQFYEGTTLLGAATLISGTTVSGTYKLDWISAATGSRAIWARATSAQGGIGASATRSFIVNAQPNVNVLAPTAGTVVLPGATITLTAAASDVDDSISRVDFLINGVNVGAHTTASAGQYSRSWTASVAGAYSVAAIAYDSRGGTTTSAPIAYVVNNLPTVAITSPANNAVSNAGAVWPITATAADSDGTISKVEFYVGTTIVSTLTAPNSGANYLYNWTPATGGAYALKAVATDNRGSTTTSAIINVTACGAPVVSVTAPTANQVIVAPNAVAVSATANQATAGCGSIAKVEFFNGAATTPLSTITSATGPYTYSWTGLVGSATPYALRAKATDTRGLTAEQSVSFVVNNAPTTAITLPENNSAVTLGTAVTVSVAAGDTDGTIAQVELYDGAILLGTLTAPNAGVKYNFTWTPTTAGAHSLKTIAKDNRGTTTTSAIVAVSVCGAPALTITAPTVNQLFPAPATVAASATASQGTAGCGSITKVEFFDDAATTALATVTTPTAGAYPFSWANLAGRATPYTLRVKATDSRGLTKEQSVAFIVNALPTVAVTTPANAALLDVGLASTITVSATDSDGSIAKVEFFDGATLLSTLTTANAVPNYTFSWTPSVAGAHAITAVATDNRGSTKTSTAVNITACAAPTVDLTSPAAGANYLPPATISLAATAGNATAGCGTITKVEFYAGANLLNADTTAPYAFDHTNVATGVYTYTAKVTTSRSISKTSAPVTVTANKLPTVTLAAACATTPCNPPATINLTATPADADGTISKVDFYNGATLVGSKNAAPWTLAVTGVPSGSVTYTAKATDNLGGVGTSAQTAAIRVNTPPTVAIVSAVCANGTPCQAPTAITLTATATDDVNVSKVEFYTNDNSLLLGEAILSGSNWVWTGTDYRGGVSTVTAKAYDGEALTTISAPYSITVGAPITVTQGVNCTPVGSSTSRLGEPPTPGQSPANVTCQGVPQLITFAAAITNYSGTVARVDYCNGVNANGTCQGVIASSTTGPNFSATYHTTNAQYGLSPFAIAYAPNGSRLGLSGAVVMTINPQPVFTSFTSVCTPTPCTAGGSIALSATVTDANNGVIQQVKFEGDGAAIATLTTPPFNVQVASLAPGAHTYRATAYDTQGGITLSAPINVTVANPNVRFADQSTIVATPGGAITLTASYSGSLGATFTTSWGQTVSCTGASGCSTSATAPTSSGVYTVDVTYPLGTTASDTLAVTVSGPPSVTDIATPATSTVGSVPGSLSISNSGATTYSIPIAVPPGINGLQPNLSLDYNSNAGNGHLGVGWTLGGLSVIARCPKTRAQDSLSAGINYDDDRTNDAYCLDGQRLIAITAVGSDSVAYRTELESYSRITSFTNATSKLYVIGPDYFKVETKSGLIMYYASRHWVLSRGFDQNAACDPSPCRINSVKHWVLDRVEDRAGNYMEIDYADTSATTGGLPVVVAPVRGSQNIFTSNVAAPVGGYYGVEYFPTEIRYGYNQTNVNNSTTSSQVINTVRFDFSKTRPAADQFRGFDPGAGQAVLTRYLSNVKTYTGNSLVSTTLLCYSGATVCDINSVPTVETNSSRLHLRKVTRCDAAGNCLQPTSFDLETTTTGLSMQEIPTATDPYNTQWMDVNGDGVIDFITANGLGTKVCLGQVDSAGNYSAPNCNTAALSLSGVKTYADVNGDGFPDHIIKRSNPTSYDFNTCVTNPNAFLAGSQFLPGISSIWGDLSPSSIPCNFTSISKPFNTDYWGGSIQGDFDGDGRIDTMVLKQYESPGVAGGGKITFEIYRPGSQWVAGSLAQTITFENPYPAFGTVNYQQIVNNLGLVFFAVDLNGDGKTDILQRGLDTPSGTQWKACLSNDQGIITCPPDGTWTTTGDGSSAPLFADFNGDGLPDAFSSKLCLSAGDGTFKRSISSNGATADNCHDVSAISTAGSGEKYIGDFNGDGRADFIRYNGNTNWEICYSRGNTVSDTSTPPTPGLYFDCKQFNGVALSNGAPDPFPTDFISNVRVVDAFGYGRSDLIMNKGGKTYLVRNSAKPTGRIKSITTGLGHTTSVSYAPLTDSSVYKRQYGAPNSNEVRIQKPLYVVKSVSSSNGIGGTNTSQYFYEDLIGNTQGRGLLGFGKRRMVDVQGNVTQTQYVNTLGGDPNNWPFAGLVTRSLSFYPTGSGFGYSLSADPEAAGSGLQKVSQIDNTWQKFTPVCNPAGTQCSQTVYLASSTVQSWDAGGTQLPTVTTAATVDSYDNPTQIVQTVKSIVGASTPTFHTSTTTNTFETSIADYLNSWLIGRLASSSVTYQNYDAAGVATGAPITRTMSYTHQTAAKTIGGCGPVPGIRCSETIEPGFPNATASENVWQSTGYSYDQYGNRTNAVVSFKDSANVLQSRQVASTYSPDGRFVATLTNEVGHVISMTSDYRFGGLSTTTSPIGLYGQNTYDGFGRNVASRRYNVAGGSLSDVEVEVVTPCQIDDPLYSIATAACAPNEVTRTRAQVANGASTYSFRDVLGRVVRRKTQAFNRGTWAETRTTYDSYGRMQRVEAPGPGGVLKQVNAFNGLNQVVATTTSSADDTLATVTCVNRNGLTTTTTTSPVPGLVCGGNGTVASATASDQATVQIADAAGRIIEMRDANFANNGNRATTYTYFADGLVASVSPVGKPTESMTYDRIGRKIQSISPSAGNSTSYFNGLGELEWSIDGRNWKSIASYDALGRMVTRKFFESTVTSGTPSYESLWRYDADAVDNPNCGTGAKGNLCTAIAKTNGAIVHEQFVQYDSLGRAIVERNALDHATTKKIFRNVASFDSQGRTEQLGRPGGEVLRYSYADSATSAAHNSWAGYVYALTNADGTTTHWQGTNRALDGTLTGFKLGAGASTTVRSYNGLGQLSAIATGTSGASDLQNALYSFDRLGNLKQRGDSALLGGAPLLATEYFSYDKLNRLTHKGVSPNPSLASEELATYDAIGNFITKAGVPGTYTYDVGTNRLSSIASASPRSFVYDANGNLNTDSGDIKGPRSVAYTPFDQPKNITQVNETISYTYDAYGKRIKEASTTSGSTYYLPGAEYHLPTGSVGVASGTSQLQEHKTYLASPDGVIGTHIKRSSLSGGALPSGYPATTLRYWHKDHLGSVVLITRADGSIAQRFRYDAWGKRSRDSASAQSNNADSTDESRGYTEHEHLDEVGLTHMNGRLHDPVLGRFLSADPYVADGYDSQSLNRYSYVYNNPLAYSDPSGYVAQGISAAGGIGMYGGGGGYRGSRGGNSHNTVLPYSSLSVMSVVGSAYYGSYADQSITSGDVERAIFHVFAARGALVVGQTDKGTGTAEGAAGAGSVTTLNAPDVDAREREQYVCANGGGCKGTEIEGLGRTTVTFEQNPNGGPDKFVIGWEKFAPGGESGVGGGGGGSSGNSSGGLISGYVNRAGDGIAYAWQKAEVFRHLEALPGGALVIRGPKVVGTLGPRISSAVSNLLSSPLRSTVKGVATEVRFHHPFPQYLGGRFQQLLEPLPKNLHDAYHSGLDKILPRQIRGAATEYYGSLSAAEKVANLNKLKEYTQAFDKIHGTKLWEAAVREGVWRP